MILSDKDIVIQNALGNISIDPFNEKNIQPASYDLHLDRHFMKFKSQLQEIDLKKPLEDDMISWSVEKGESLLIYPGEFLLGVTEETVGVSGKVAARMDGKSSLGRVGLFIHITAGFIDPGNKLKLTLEMLNVSGRPIRVYPSMPIAQVSFHLMESESGKKYGDESLNSKYFGATRPQASQFYKNFKKE